MKQVEMVGLRIAVAAAAVALAAAVTIGVSDSSLLYVWWVIAPGIATGAIAVGIHRNRPVARGPWATLLVSVAMLWIGWSISASVASNIVTTTAEAALTVVRDSLYAVAYPLIGVGSWMLVRARTGGRDRVGFIDGLIIIAALTTLIGAWLFGGGDSAADVGMLDQVWVRVSPLVLAAVVTAGIRLLFLAGFRTLSIWFIFVSSILALVGNLWSSQLVRLGQPTELVAIDVLWVAAFFLVAAAALDPSMREVGAPIAEELLTDGLPVDRLALIFIALAVAPIAHLRVQQGTTQALLVSAGGVVIAVLVMIRVVMLLHDRDRARRDLQHAVLHDPLTGLPNRTLALDRLEHLLDNRSTPSVTVAFLDLDSFKPVNDRFGHDIGDQALCDIASNLRDAVRPGDTVARFAGDEFLVIADGVEDQAIAPMLERLRRAAELPISRGGQSLVVGASVGAATATPGAVSADELIRQADAAMYSDKSRRSPG